MPGAGLLTVLDDIATVLDDVAVLTKIAAKKTAGVLGDDLALNAQQVAGVRANRELPVVWGVAKGSLVNKAILVPIALVLSAVSPWAVIPLLMIGGAYLCFEGFEKVAHKLLTSPHEQREDHAKLLAVVSDPNIDPLAFEKDKIRGAVRTDFILSAEIVAIALGLVAHAPIVTRVAVLVGLGFLMTVAVYGLVAGIVKLDDLGLYLTRSRSSSSDAGTGLRQKLGAMLLRAAPYLMKALSIGGTVAMFLVGGGILSHGIPFVHHWVEHQGANLKELPGAGGFLAAILPTVVDAIVGVAAGAVLLLAVTGIKRGIRALRT